MSVRNFKKFQTEDKDSRQIQENIQEAMEPIIRSPIVDGVIVKNVCLKPDQVSDVKHGLGRAPLGWIIVRKRQDIRIWDLQDCNPTPKRTLTLVSSHEGVVDVWIF